MAQLLLPKSTRGFLTEREVRLVGIAIKLDARFESQYQLSLAQHPNPHRLTRNKRLVGREEGARGLDSFEAR